MITGDAKYNAAVDGELTRATEELYRLHAGDPTYLTWLEESDKASHQFLTQLPGKIELRRGLYPFELLKAMIDFYLSLHTLFFHAWKYRAHTAQDFFARVGSPSGGWKM